MKEFADEKIKSCLITGVLKMLIVIVVMIIICLIMAKVGE